MKDLLKFNIMEKPIYIIDKEQIISDYGVKYWDLIDKSLEHYFATTSIDVILVELENCLNYNEYFQISAQGCSSRDRVFIFDILSCHIEGSRLISLSLEYINTCK